MNRARRKAEEVIKEYGNNLGAILEILDIDLLEVAMKGRLKEIFFGDHIVLRRDLSYLEKQELTAHALGHHFMHSGSHYAAARKIYTFSNYHEKQANIFAAYLLIPEDELEKTIYPDVKASDIAESFEVTPEFATFRLELYKATKSNVRA
jgi:hypothetical protein